MQNMWTDNSSTAYSSAEAVKQERIFMTYCCYISKGYKVNKVTDQEPAYGLYLEVNNYSHDLTYKGSGTSFVKKTATVKLYEEVDSFIEYDQNNNILWKKVGQNLIHSSLKTGTDHFQATKRALKKLPKCKLIN